MSRQRKGPDLRPEQQGQALPRVLGVINVEVVSVMKQGTKHDSLLVDSFLDLLIISQLFGDGRILLNSV
jgi:hypothetical protein